MYKGTYLGQSVAVKVLKSEMMKKHEIKELSDECEVMKKLKHDNIVQLIKKCTVLIPVTTEKGQVSRTIGNNL